MFLVIFLLSGCMTLSEIDNADLNRVYAQRFAKQLKAEPDAPLVYFNLVKLKIENRARRIYFLDRKLKDKGLVKVNFTLNSDGAVKEIGIIEESLAENSILQEVVVEAIHAASPFLPFFKTIKNDVLNFTVEIGFG